MTLGADKDGLGQHFRDGKEVKHLLGRHKVRGSMWELEAHPHGSPFHPLARDPIPSASERFCRTVR